MQANVQFPVEVRGHMRTVTWNGRALTILDPMGSAVTVPAGQIASVSLSGYLLRRQLAVTTTAGARHVVYYWPGQAAAFRALRDMVLGGIAAMG